MAITSTYLWPITGTTAITATQALNFNLIVIDIIATADGDTAATLTHAWAVSAADLAAGFPKVSFTFLTAAGVLSAWTLTTLATNTVVVTKSTATGSGAAPAQVRVFIERPHTMVR